MINRWLAVTMAALLAVGAGACSEPAPPAPSSATDGETTDGETTGGEPPSASPYPSTTEPIDTFAPPGWVDLSSVDSTILVEMRYYSVHNFVGRRVAGYLEPVCLLPERTAQALRQVQARAVAQGYTLKVYDCYRPARAVADFAAWGTGPDTTMQAEFFPTLTKAQVVAGGFVATGHSNHSSGRAVDLTLVALPAAPQREFVTGEPLVACTAPAGERFPDNSIDMGAGFDCFDSRAHTLDPRITGAPHENRLRLKALMEFDGLFTNYAGEWWHFDLNNPPYPGQYFDFPVARAALT